MELATFIPPMVMRGSAKVGMTGGGFMVWARLRPIWEAVNSCRADGADATIYASRSNEKEEIPMAKRGNQSGGRMTSKAASRIQSAGAKSGGGKVAKGSFPSRAQRAASKSSK